MTPVMFFQNYKVDFASFLQQRVPRVLSCLLPIASAALVWIHALVLIFCLFVVYYSILLLVSPIRHWLKLTRAYIIYMALLNLSKFLDAIYAI